MPCGIHSYHLTASVRELQEVACKGIRSPAPAFTGRQQTTGIDKDAATPHFIETLDS